MRKDARLAAGLIVAFLAAFSCPPPASCQRVVSGKPPAAAPEPVLEIGADDGFQAVAFSPDGRRLAAGSHFGYIQIREIPSGRLQRTLPGRSSSYRYEWPWRTKAKSLFRIMLCSAVPVCRGHADDVNALAFSPDGKFLATGGDDGTVRIWNWAAGKEPHVLRHQINVTALAFLPDGRLATGTYSAPADAESWPSSTGKSASWIRIWDIKTEEVLAEAPLPTAGTSLCVDRAGRILAVGLHSGSPRLLGLPSLKLLKTIEGEPPFTTVELSPDGRTLLTAGHDNEPKGAIGVHDIASGRTRRFPGPASLVRLTPDGRRAISADLGKSATLWDLATGRKLAVYPHRNSVTAVAVSPDGRYFATTTVVNALRVWALP